MNNTRAPLMRKINTCENVEALEHEVNVLKYIKMIVNTSTKAQTMAYVRNRILEAEIKARHFKKKED